MLQLKDTVEGLLALPSINVWNIHGGLERLDRCIRHILKHRLKTTSVLMVWIFILYHCNYGTADNKNASPVVTAINTSRNDGS